MTTLQLSFGGPPPAAHRQVLRERGWRWSPMHVAWRRPATASDLASVDAGDKPGATAKALSAAIRAGRLEIVEPGHCPRLIWQSPTYTGGLVTADRDDARDYALGRISREEVELQR